MKKNKTNIIIAAVIIAVIIGLAAFYIYDVVYNKTPYDENLFRILAVICMLIATVIRVLKTGYGRRTGLDEYEKVYSDDIGFAFQNKLMQKKKLLCAIRLFHEKNYRKALKYLYELLKECEFDRDTAVVLLFIALCYANAGYTEDAIKVYYELLKIEPNNARVHSNLGLQLMNSGDFESALKHYNKSIELKPDNYFAYVNRANYYFRRNENDNAVADAKKALDIKNNGIEAANLLAIIYALKNDEENKKKYFHIAITSGKNPDELNEAIQFYLNENSIATAEEKPVMPIPPMEEITEKLSREEPKLVDCEIIRVIYSRDKTKRFILFRSDKGFYKYTYEQIFVFDEEEWGIVSHIHENPYPAYWGSVDSFCARSFFGTEEDALSALKQETEYLQYFE